MKSFEESRGEEVIFRGGCETGRKLGSRGKCKMGTKGNKAGNENGSLGKGTTGELKNYLAKCETDLKEAECFEVLPLGEEYQGKKAMIIDMEKQECW